MQYLVIVLSFFIIGCSNINAKITHEITHHKNGRIENDITLVNGVRDGKVFSYFEDGTLSVKGYFKNGERDREWYFYDENTKKISAIENYSKGKLEGEQLYYYPNGKLKLTGNYKSDIRVGFWEMYDETGRLDAQNIFLDGEKMVSVALYHKNGEILCSGIVKDGLRDGLWKYFDEEGKILYDVEYREGIRDGRWRAYSNTGELIVSGYYTKGKILGLD
ncbi:toxin-antitoxin system YwqK family antitoxin [Fusobacterium sp.]|uniref:toxin-antitoxin system YwqK family antitoxin n=1 Tax=Fusobacterium sp. TaxID=68766 RepID=UPI0025B86E48|nr:toxin-antitoxin system YwqK family antitoxin [Fusobacterium sp.]